MYNVVRIFHSNTLNFVLFFSFDHFNSVPFNTEEYVGFYIELFVQMFTVHFYMLIFSSVFSLFSAFAGFTDGLIDDYLKSTNNINEILENFESKKMSESKKKQEIVKFLKESVDLHGGIMAAVENLIEIMSGPLFFELFTFVAFLAINVFIIDRVSL